MDFLDDVPLQPRCNIFFQQDEALLHFTQTGCKFLNIEFHNKWTGWQGPVEWPQRPPDFMLPDFVLWEHLKSVVYRNVQEPFKN
jgi:hypothetical protein